MNTKTVRELRSIAKDKGLLGFYKLKKNDLVALLLEQSAEEMPTPAPRIKVKKRRSCAPIKIIPNLQKTKNAVSKAFSRIKNSMLEVHDIVKKTVKGYVEGETRNENQEEEYVNFKPYEHERALRRTYRSFVVPGKPKTGNDSYSDQTKPYIKTLIENQLTKMGPAKVIMTLWVIWKKLIKLLIDPEGLEDVLNKGKPSPLVRPSTQEMDAFEKEEMKKGRSLVKIS